MSKKYCKAYYVKDLRQFGKWEEKREENEQELTDEDVVYLWDDFTVVRSPVIPDKGLIFENATDEWKSFCKATLHFEIPEDLRYAYEQTEEADEVVRETSSEAEASKVSV